MTQDNGGEEHLAPVIPLFGDGVAAEPAWRSTWDEDPPLDADRGSDVPGDGSAAVDPRSRSGQRRDAGGRAAHRGARDHRVPGEDAEGPMEPPDPAVVENVVLKKLRARPLSEAEVRGIIASHALDDAAADDLMRGLRRHGYVDDHALAEQLVRSATERKGQGRQVVAQTLVKRQIPRAVVDAALAALPDDDAERALAFAKTKARAMSRLDRDTALRRLAGQLARRGYSSSVAMGAARQALDDVED
jgi:regulatory protein